MALVYAQQQWWAQWDGLGEGINLTDACLTNGNCTRDIYDTLNIREEQADVDGNTFEFFVQDIFLSATFFIGTILAFSLIYSGFKIIMGWWGNDSMVEEGKSGVKWSIVWLVLVMFSYTIIRAVQFVAQGNS